MGQSSETLSADEEASDTQPGSLELSSERLMLSMFPISSPRSFSWAYISPMVINFCLSAIATCPESWYDENLDAGLSVQQEGSS